MNSPLPRVGIGYDVHRLQRGLPLWIGGVRIPHEKGCVAHSDGDALIHAICDALLGAATLGDIGQHFPDSDPQFANIDSKILLQRCTSLLTSHGWAISNIDSIVMLQAPKIMGYIPQMRAILAQTMQIAVEQVSVKATTTEQLGFIGRTEGIAAQAIALLRIL